MDIRIATEPFAFLEVGSLMPAPQTSQAVVSDESVNRSYAGGVQTGKLAPRLIAHMRILLKSAFLTVASTELTCFVPDICELWSSRLALLTFILVAGCNAPRINARAVQGAVVRGFSIGLPKKSCRFKSILVAAG